MAERFDPNITPAGKPPPGVIPDPNNAPSRKGLINAISIIFPAVSLVFVILRIYARTVVSRAFGLDDGE